MVIRQLCVCVPNADVVCGNVFVVEMVSVCNIVISIHTIMCSCILFVPVYMCDILELPYAA